MLYSPVMETLEYKNLFANAKLAYPHLDEYFIQVACLAYLNDQGIKSSNNVVVTTEHNEIQEELSAQ